MNRNIENKYEILKARLINIIEEHADALALAQQFKQELTEAKIKISELEGKLNEKNTQEKEPGVTITRE